VDISRFWQKERDKEVKTLFKDYDFLFSPSFSYDRFYEHYMGWVYTRRLGCTCLLKDHEGEKGADNLYTAGWVVVVLSRR
jgi:hypothetical protein